MESNNNNTNNQEEEAAQPAAVTAVEATHESSLLRDWESSHAPAPTPASAASNTSGPPATPPVAPAVFLNDDAVTSPSRYPVVATFVSHVRSAVDEIANHIQDHMHHAHTHVHSHCPMHNSLSAATTTTSSRGNNHVPSAFSSSSGTSTGTDPRILSIRSDGGLPSASARVAEAPVDSVRSVPNHPSQNNNSHSNNSSSNTMSNNRRYSEDMMMNDQTADYVLIDGDLVALPPPPNEQERQGIEDYKREQDFLNHKSCNPKPMRKGMRGFKKWITKRTKKRKDKEKEKNSIRQQIQQEETLFTQQTDATSSLNASMSTEDQQQQQQLEPYTSSNSISQSPRTKSPMRGWKITSKRDKNHKDDSKRKRKSWLRTDPKKLEQHDFSADDGGDLQHNGEQQLEDDSSIRTTAQSDVASYPPTAAAAAAHSPPRHHHHHHHHPPQQQAYDALNSNSLPPPALPPMPGAPSHQSSVHASFVGNADQLLEANVLQGATCAEAYIENPYAYGAWEDEKKDGEMVASVLPRDTDYKVDKADAPDVEYMLRRAAQESENDVLETSWGDMDEDGEHNLDNLDPLAVPSSGAFMAMASPGKTSGMLCPLSTAKVTDQQVYNDVLKVVMVGAPNVDKSALARAVRQSKKKPKRRTTLGVDVHTWSPDMGTQDPVKFSIWDVQGAPREDGSANFGGNPGIQSLFFSSSALYLLVWDLAADNVKTYGRDLLMNQLDCDSDDDEDDCDNQFLFEEAERQADLALQTDIEQRVLSWVDCIARRGPGSSILPVAVIPENMNSSEAKRRCDMMQNLLERHITKFQGDHYAPKLLIGMDNIMCVSLADFGGIHELQETLIAIATDESVFEHVGTIVTPSTVKVLDAVRRLKLDHKLIRVDHLMASLPRHSVSYEEVIDALHFLSSIGEVLYFGTDDDELLSRFVVLSRKWYISALSCILRNDLKRELSETRRFMNMQCIYSDHQFPENPVIQSLTNGSASSCPLLSSTDTNMLWLSMQFMREAADQSSQLSESSTTASTMFEFLERLLVQSGVFLPLGVSQSISDPEVYFVPSLMANTTNQDDVWTFKSNESWVTTLTQAFLLRDGAPSDLFDHITVGLVRDLYEFSRTFAVLGGKHPPQRSQTFPLVRSGEEEFLQAHDSKAIGRIKIHQIMCWQSAFLVKIGCIFADSESGDLKESFVEVFVTLVDQSSSHCVASDQMRATMQRLVVSGKGQAGSSGAKLWKGGYGVVLESIQSTLGNFANIDRQVVCPECLAHSQPRYASTWSWDSVKAAAESGSSIVRCIRGHRADSNLICGTEKRQEMSVVHEHPIRSVKPVPELLPSVVLVGLWDAETKEIRNVGSGFVVDKRLGLVVTAGHILFNMSDDGGSFGAPYYGLKNARVVIGVIPEGADKAVFRYFAEIVSDDIYCVDACVVRLTSKLVKDVDGDVAQKQAGQTQFDLQDTPLNLEAIHQENLKSIKLTSRFELEESVRILGFNQGGEGVLEKGKHINLSADFAKGYICKKFVAPPMSDDDSSHSSDMSSKSMFSPREEIVVICPTINGHSGGPCVNNDGKVVGILSRADPGERQRCYLVPSSELKDLIKKAKKQFTRPSLLI